MLEQFATEVYEFHPVVEDWLAAQQDVSEEMVSGRICVDNSGKIIWMNRLSRLFLHRVRMGNIYSNIKQYRVIENLAVTSLTRSTTFPTNSFSDITSHRKCISSSESICWFWDRHVSVNISSHGSVLGASTRSKLSCVICCVPVRWNEL